MSTEGHDRYTLLSSSSLIFTRVCYCLYVCACVCQIIIVVSDQQRSYDVDLFIWTMPPNNVHVIRIPISTTITRLRHERPYDLDLT